MGYIQKDELFFPDEASDTFRLLNRSYPNTEENRKADLALAGCLLTQGKFDEAKEMYQEMFETRQAKQDFFWISALVHLAEIHFMQEEFDTALKVLEEITQSDFDPSQAAEPMLNDGLCLRLFLKSHTRDNPEPLILFARGVKHEKQRQFKQAIIVLDSLISLWSGTSVIAEALLMKGKIHMGLNQNKKALSALNIIIKQHPMSMVSDQAMERKGWILEKTGKRKEALDTYEALLLKYPQSFLIDEIRIRIRRLEEEI